jgi:hypothetical protein
VDTFDRLPDELKSYNQWVVWRYEPTDTGKPAKVLYDCNSLHKASTTNPLNWVSFRQAVALARSGHFMGFAGIGFVFADDPYTGIDLDDAPTPEVRAVQENLFRQFDSYSELSPSGKGLHIIIRARLPGEGRRRNSIEMYDRARYFTMTGNVIHNAPIAERQLEAEQLYSTLSEGRTLPLPHSISGTQTQSDEAIVQQAVDAANGDKFSQLLQGEWQGYYPSQSEADFAFINIVAYYTDNHEQVLRIFQNSPLGQREKGKRLAYVTPMIRRAFDQKIPMADVSALYAVPTAAQPEPEPEPESEPEPEPEPALDIAAPRGLLGDIARFIYQASPRPAPMVSVTAALGLMAGLCGRAWNVSGTGLNVYVLLLAPTGTGKEAISSGLAKLVAHVASIKGDSASCPAIEGFIGPSEIQSAQGLLKTLSNNACFVSLIGEFGMRLQAMSSRNAPPNDVLMKRMLLALYGASGRGNTYGGMAYSDKEKNVARLQSPAFSIIAESTPETFLRAIDESVIADGLLPRFLVLRHTAGRSELNRNAHSATPSHALTNDLATLTTTALNLARLGSTVDVTLTPEAEALASRFDRYCDDQINAADAEVLRHLWNRAHLKVLKIAALIAVGVNPNLPTVTAEDIQWAQALVEYDVRVMTRQFVRGEVGADAETSDNRQHSDVIDACEKYNATPAIKLHSYGVKPTAHAKQFIGLTYLSRKCCALASFRNDKRRPTPALKAAINELKEQGLLIEISRNDLNALLGPNAGRHFLLNKQTQ